MLPVATAARCRALDAACIEGLGIPGRQLMEVAGRGAAEAVHARWPGRPVAVLCGSGNNGGDGYVVARWLHLWGHPVRLWASAPAKTEDARVNAALCARMGLEPVALDEALAGDPVVVDALLGTGQTGAPRGAIGEAVAAARATAGPRVALDLPTGVHSDTGQVLGAAALSADLTVTFGRWKPGLLAMPGAELAGEVEVVDIGLDLGALHDAALAAPTAWLLEAADVAAWSPGRAAGGAKWDRGHVAIRGGGGASVLAARGAFAAGAGLVTVLAPRSDWAHLHGLPPEVILAEPEALNPKRHDAVVVGPGLGTDAAGVVRDLWGGFPGAVVADADALTLLARHPTEPPAGAPRARTPHSAEAARLLGCTRDEVEADRFAAARRLGPGALLKGPCSLVCGPTPWVNPTGGPALATAGTGDVLAGMVGGLLAQGLPVDRALALAAWRHGRAGESMPPQGTASDLLVALRQPGG